MGQKVGLEEGFPANETRKPLLLDLLLSLFREFPQNLLLIYFRAPLFFSGISSLVDQAGRHN